MINPIEHSKTKEAANKYKVEPYVVAADIYGAGNLAGRGGWTWYTGSSSWMFVAGLKYILGINMENGILRIEPHVPSNWENYSVRFKFGESLYNVKIIRAENVNEKKFMINGENVSESQIQLDGSGKIFNIVVDI